jgi:galactofuranose transport system substrate-binding protein
MFVKRRHLAVATALAAVLALSLAGCSEDSGSGNGSGDEDLITVGFVAVGPEGAWREANEKNMQETFTKEAGFDLRYAPATNLDQKSQIDAFTAFVDEEVDVILLSATEGSGWEAPLRRAQEAEIPVILIDRGIEPDDSSLYVTRIAPDNFVVAQGVAEWALSAAPEGAKYFTLEGPAGVGVVNERNRGWDSVMDSHPEFVKVGAQTANWSTEEAKGVFETVLRANNNDIQIVFAQNDEMGLGAALAVEEAGLTPGVDVKIATIDGTRGAMEALAAARLSFVAEYNPLFGQTALEVVLTVLDGGSVDSYIIVPSGTFDSPEAASEALPNRQY